MASRCSGSSAGANVKGFDSQHTHTFVALYTCKCKLVFAEWLFRSLLWASAGVPQSLWSDARWLCVLQPTCCSEWHFSIVARSAVGFTLFTNSQWERKIKESFCRNDDNRREAFLPIWLLKRRLVAWCHWWPITRTRFSITSAQFFNIYCELWNMLVFVSAHLDWSSWDEIKVQKWWDDGVEGSIYNGW